MRVKSLTDKAKEECQTLHYSKSEINQMKQKVEKIIGVELIFKALSDATRLKVAYALTLAQELCVHDVANLIGSTTATASHHLRLLREMKLASSRREGKLVFYSLDDDHVRQLVYIAMIHAREGEDDEY
jgi:DNA-binding transcriptional ArsR family regulator